MFKARNTHHQLTPFLPFKNKNIVFPTSTQAGARAHTNTHTHTAPAPDSGRSLLAPSSSLPCVRQLCLQPPALPGHTSASRSGPGAHPRIASPTLLGAHDRRKHPLLQRERLPGQAKGIGEEKGRRVGYFTSHNKGKCCAPCTWWLRSCGFGGNAQRPTELWLGWKVVGVSPHHRPRLEPLLSPPAVLTAPRPWRPSGARRFPLELG